MNEIPIPLSGKKKSDETNSGSEDECQFYSSDKEKEQSQKSEEDENFAHSPLIKNITNALSPDSPSLVKRINDIKFVKNIELTPSPDIVKEISK